MLHKHCWRKTQSCSRPSEAPLPSKNSPLPENGFSENDYISQSDTPLLPFMSISMKEHFYAEAKLQLLHDVGAARNITALMKSLRTDRMQRNEPLPINGLDSSVLPQPAGNLPVQSGTIRFWAPVPSPQRQPSSNSSVCTNLSCQLCP
ncbi:hypothetical protein NQZ68_026168 [Dissostichus eleginoides]|nr:hypothetical protein NQZ68_026168 [Dissostichus eleginoides]